MFFCVVDTDSDTFFVLVLEVTEIIKLAVHDMLPKWIHLS